MKPAEAVNAVFDSDVINPLGFSTQAYKMALEIRYLIYSTLKGNLK